MQSDPKSRRFTLVICSLLFIFVNIFTLFDGHNWGDDFAQYLLHAKNLLNHAPYASRIMLDRVSVCPPGYPLILVPFLKCFGLNFVLLKSLNIFFWLGFVWLIYFLARKRLGEDPSFLIALALLSSPQFFLFKQNTLSDIPFLFFLTLALYLFQREESSEKNHKIWLAACSLLMAWVLLMRWAGIVLFIAVGIYALIRRRGTIFLGALAGLILAWVIQKIMGISAQGHLQEAAVPFGQWVKSTLADAPHVYYPLINLFIPSVVPLSFLEYKIFIPILDWVFPIAFLGMIIGCIYKINKRSLSLLSCFFVLYLLSLIVWPFKSESRYALPVMGLALIFCAEALMKIRAQKIAEIFLMLLISQNILITVLKFDFNDDMIYNKPTREMVDWVKANTALEDHFMFWKPRAINLLTGRVGAPPWLDRSNQLVGRIKKYNISILIFFRREDAAIIQALEAQNNIASSVWENDLYKVFRINPSVRLSN